MSSWRNLAGTCDCNSYVRLLEGSWWTDIIQRPGTDARSGRYRRPEEAGGPHPGLWVGSPLSLEGWGEVSPPTPVMLTTIFLDFRQFHFSTIWPDPTFSAQKVGGQKQMRTTLESFLDAQLFLSPKSLPNAAAQPNAKRSRCVRQLHIREGRNWWDPKAASASGLGQDAVSA